MIGTEERASVVEIVASKRVENRRGHGGVDQQRHPEEDRRMSLIDFGACFLVVCRTSTAADGVGSPHAPHNCEGSHRRYDKAVVEITFNQTPR